MKTRDADEDRFTSVESVDEPSRSLAHSTTAGRRQKRVSEMTEAETGGLMGRTNNAA